MLIDRRLLLATCLTLPFAAPLRAAERTFTPEDFGAKGDGKTDDSAAMARLSSAVSLYGGGTVVFRKTTYLVGRQGLALKGRYLFPPTDLLKFAKCSGPLVLQGNGARLKAAAGLRYGVFDDRGNVRHTQMPYLGDGLASPYVAMIEVSDCTGPVRISDFDLEGSTATLVVGGQFGDVGWQVPGSGIVLRDNRGSELVERVHTHHHPTDGIMIDGTNDPAPGSTRRFIGVRCDSNGRQGCSLVGGKGYRFVDCSFSRSGRGKIMSPPGAGFDIEAEGTKRIRDLAFDTCRFVDNAGVGLVADSGDSAEVRFSRCTFVGTTSWSAWPRKPFMRFADCSFTGAICNAYGDADPAKAAQFLRCTFDEDPAKSPTGKVYGGANASRPLADLSSEKNMLFDRCRFLARHGGTLPWSTAAIYQDCTMIQTSKAQGYPRGTYRGRNSITGNVGIAGSRILGSLVVNGVPQR